MATEIYARASTISKHSTSFFIPFIGNITQGKILLKKRKIMIAL